MIEVLLPLKPTNGARGSDLRRVRDALLPSFNRFCDPAFVARFTIVAPDADLPALAGLQEASDLDLTLLGEQALLGPEPVPARGWFIQQMVKIAYAGVCRTPWYLTLDADTFLLDCLDARVLQGGRAPTQLEPVGQHPGWWPASAATLHAPQVPADRPVLGVTPAVLSAEIMRRVLDRLSRLAAARGLQWPAYLASMVGDGYRCWTEYALYWTTLAATDEPDRLHQPWNTYVHCQSLHEAQIRIRPGATSQQPLFGVLQSSSVAVAAHVSYVRQMLQATEPARDERRRRGLHGGYHHVPPGYVRDTLLAGGDTWLVSASGNADPLAAALGMPSTWADYRLINRVPAPPPLPEKPGLRAIYVIDDPAAAVAAMAAGGQADICKNNNINFVPAFWHNLTAADYLGAGEDLLNLYGSVRNWTDPEGPLARTGYRVLILRLSQLARHTETILDFLDPGANAAALRRRLRAVPPPPPVDPWLSEWIAALYAPLIAYIDAFPGAALWDGRAGTLLALEPP